MRILISEKMTISKARSDMKSSNFRGYRIPPPNLLKSVFLMTPKKIGVTEKKIGSIRYR